MISNIHLRGRINKDSRSVFRSVEYMLLLFPSFLQHNIIIIIIIICRLIQYI